MSMVVFTSENIKLSNCEIQKVNYKESIYYFNNGHDITKYVKKAVGNGKYVTKSKLEQAVTMFNSEHHQLSKYKYFNLVLHDNKHTSINFIELFCEDVLRLSREELNEMTRTIHNDGSWLYKKPMSYEMAVTLCCILERGNRQRNQHLECDVVESPDVQCNIDDIIKTAIQRDYPEDF